MFSLFLCYTFKLLSSPGYSLIVLGFLFYLEASHSALPYQAKVCKLPAFVANEKGLLQTVAGLSSVLRKLLFVNSEDHPLLGFRQSCLIACAEVSVWTRFCEVSELLFFSLSILLHFFEG